MTNFYCKQNPRHATKTLTHNTTMPAAPRKRPRVQDDCDGLQSNSNGGGDGGTAADSETDDPYESFDSDFDQAEVAADIVNDFKNVPLDLRNRGSIQTSFPMDTYKDENNILQPTLQSTLTMDAVHKCLAVIPPDDPSLMTAI